MRHSLQILLVFIFSIFLITISITQSHSQEYIEPKVEIVELYSYPELPLAGHYSKVTITIKNTGFKTDSFKVKLYILKEGSVEHEESFEFRLSAGEIGINSTQFVPASRGEYKIHGEVLDIYESKLYDVETIDVKVKSEIGPFDALVDIITTFPYPGKEVIALMTVVNKGIEKVDVTVNYRIEGTGMSGEYTTAPEPESESSRPIFLIAPLEPDLYTLSVEVRYLGSLVASSFGKFFVNPEEYLPMLEIKGIPSVIKIEQRESENLSIAVDNIGNVSIHDLQIITKGIPLEWLRRWPSFIYEVEANGSRIFLVSLDVPEDAHVGEYPIEFIAAAKETSSREPSNLIVLESLERIEGEVVKVPSMHQFLGIIAVIVVTVVIVVLIFERRRREDKWRKLREKWVGKLTAESS